MSKELAQHLSDVFRLFGPVSLKRMFSGYGIFSDGFMFGLVHDEVLYLKTDAQSVADFEALGLGQFQYVRNGKTVGLSYYQAPESVLEDIHEAALWARRAFEAALRSEASKTRSPRRRPSPPADD
jgi:DNA transformation protein